MHPLTRPLALSASALLLAATASAGVVSSATWPISLPSRDLDGSSMNQTAVYVSGNVNAIAKKLKFSGQLKRVNAATRPNEACIRVRRLINISQGLSLLTHEFVVQPFAQGTTFRAVGSDFIATIPDYFFAIPTPLSPTSTGANVGDSAYASLATPGTWTFEFFENYDDSGPSPTNGSAITPDAIWENFAVEFDDAEAALPQNISLIGQVGTTMKYNIKSDDTLGSGSFTGGYITPLNMPPAGGGNRIRYMRISGFITTTLSSTTNASNFHPTSDAKIRLTRNESVLASPNDPSPLTTTSEKLISLPAGLPSTGYVNIEMPIASNDPFGTLSRVLSTSPNESGYSLTWAANLYEGTDSTGIDNVWNQLRIEFFTSPNPFPCTIADVAGLGGTPGADGQLTADDVVVFIAAYFAGNTSVADVAVLGGAVGHDGQLTADDIVAFLGAFFTGCN
jgi:hypothetical protein